MTPGQVPSTATLARGALSTAVVELTDAPDTRQQLLALLQSDPDVTNDAALRLADIGVRLLPVGTLSPVEKATYGRFKPSSEAALCDHVCDALRLAQPAGVKLGVDPQRLRAMPRRWRIYSGYHLLGTRLTNLGMDRRAVLAPMQRVLMEQALEHVHARFKDPTLSPADRAKLLDDFGPALLELDRVLSQPAARKEAIQGAKKGLAEQLAEAAAEAAYAETQLKLRQKLLVPREELLAAARHHQAQKKKAPQGHQPGDPLPPPTPQRRII